MMRPWTWAGALWLCALAASCGGEENAQPAAGGNEGAAEGAAPAGSSAAAGSKKKEEKKNDSDAPPLLSFSEADFVESDESRDPFRDYSSLFRKPIEELNKELSGRHVKAPTFALDELKLVGIVTRTNARAMLVDPNGYGWILYTGDFVGKAEMVNTGGTEGTEVPVNWKIDRIRPTDLVFVREDPARPQIPRSTRIMPLYPAGEVPASKGGT
jgi:type IV pilus assembly protein PilP